MFPPPKVPQAAPKVQEWNDLDIRTSLQDEEESQKPVSTASKKKKVKKFKKKKAGISADPNDNEFDNDRQLQHDTNESRGFAGLSSDEGGAGYSKSQKPPQRP